MNVSATHLYMIDTGSYPKSRQYILDVHKETFEVGAGFWVTFRFTLVVPTDKRPHGLKYALTMHRPQDHRVVGYDNAHIPENLKKLRFVKGGRLIAYDHKYWRDDEAVAYAFLTPEKLLEDFWTDVYRVLAEEGVP